MTALLERMRRHPVIAFFILAFGLTGIKQRAERRYTNESDAERLLSSDAIPYGPALT
jgi:hypothetical protein